MDDNRRNRDQGDTPAVEQRSLVNQVRLWGGLGGAGLLLLFLLQNLQEATVNFLWFEWEVRLVFALVASAVLGAVASLLFGFLRRRGKAAELRERAALQAERERRR